MKDPRWNLHHKQDQSKEKYKSKLTSIKITLEINPETVFYRPIFTKKSTKPFASLPTQENDTSMSKQSSLISLKVAFNFQGGLFLPCTHLIALPSLSYNFAMRVLLEDPVSLQNHQKFCLIKVSLSHQT